MDNNIEKYENLLQEYGRSGICWYAAEKGDLELLKWARSPERDPPCHWNAWVCTRAATKGHLNILKWARSAEHSAPCPWDVGTCSAAAYNEYFEILKWLRSPEHTNPCPWNSNTCRYAAEKGNVDILWYLYTHGAPYDVGRGIHENCLDFLDEFGEDWKRGTFALLGQNIKG